MKFCLLGGSGFIGSATHNYLISQGHEVFIFDLKAPSFHAQEFEKIDLRFESPSVDASFFDCVVNLAAVHKNPGHSSAEYYETNVDSALKILDWITKSPPAKFIHLSSIAVYGKTRDWVSEESRPEPVSDYGKSKLMAEKILSLIGVPGSNLKTIIIRPGVIFGKGENGNFSRMASAMARGYFLIPARTPVHKSCGYVKELAHFIEFLAIGKPKHNLYNFCFKSATFIAEITAEISLLLGVSKPKSIQIPSVPAKIRSIKVIDYIAQRIDKLQTSSFVLPSNMLNEGYEWKYDLQSALSDWEKDSKSFREL